MKNLNRFWDILVFFLLPIAYLEKATWTKCVFIKTCSRWRLMHSGRCNWWWKERKLKKTKRIRRKKIVSASREPKKSVSFIKIIDYFHIASKSESLPFNDWRSNGFTNQLFLPMRNSRNDRWWKRRNLVNFDENEIFQWRKKFLLNPNWSKKITEGTLNAGMKIWWGNSIKSPKFWTTK